MKQYPIENKSILKMAFLVMSISAVVFGIICMTIPEMISRMLVVFISVMILTYGLIELYRFFTTGIKDILMLGVILSAIGIYCLLNPQFVEQLIGTILSLFLFTFGCLNIKKATDLKTAGFKFWYTVLLFALTVCVLGILGLFNPKQAAGLPWIIIGLFFAISGLSSLVFIFILKRYIENL